MPLPPARKASSPVSDSGKKKRKINEELGQSKKKMRIKRIMFHEKPVQYGGKYWSILDVELADCIRIKKPWLGEPSVRSYVSHARRELKKAAESNLTYDELCTNLR